MRMRSRRSVRTDVHIALAVRSFFFLQTGSHVVQASPLLTIYPNMTLNFDHPTSAS